MCVKKRDYELCNSLTSVQKSRLSKPLYQVQKEKKAISHQLLEPASVKILRNESSNDAVKHKSLSTDNTSDYRKAMPVNCKESKNKMAKSSTSSENIKQLDAKWSERFSPLEAMLLARSFQPTSQPTFQNIQMVVPPRKLSTLPSDGPFVQPGLVSQTSDQLFSDSSVM